MVGSSKVARLALFQVVVLAAASGVAGCGGGTALLHPAHALPTSSVSMGAGVQGNFVLGDADDRMSAARAAVADGAVTSNGEEQAYAEGAIAHVLFAPGLAPWVGARAGIGYDTEAGLTYTGRSARVDARHAFEWEAIAVSAGLGLSGVLSRRGFGGEDDPTARGQAIPGLDASGVSGWGADVPILVGWRSDPALMQIWGGVRGGYERVLGDVILRVDPDPSLEQTASFDASRWYGAGLIGLMVSIDPVWVAVELSTAFGRAEGELDVGASHVTGKATALSLSPAAAIGGRF